MNKEFSIANGKAEYAEKYQLFDAMVDPVRGLVRGGDTHPPYLYWRDQGEPVCLYLK